MEETRILLKNLGKINPVSSADYVAAGGYKGLRKAVANPEAIVDIIKDSGLRGRGGAGFPTGLKWSFTKGTPSDQKYIICNADEGEPGTNKDRILMSGDPHSMFEGMTIAGIAVGATKGFIYLRAEYPYLLPILKDALKEAESAGYIGRNILDSGLDFDIEIRSGAGAYICGDETALMESIEGKRGEPRYKPPFPGVSGLWGKPTIINNVETLCNVPQIIDKGAEWFRSIGTKSCPGTKLFTLSGNIKNPGVYEFPMGVNMRALFEEVGGGCPGGKKLYAVQTGGASGAIINAENIDMPLDIECCTKAGAVLGAGDLMFMDESIDIINVVENLIEFFIEESCGKCTPCREGNPRLIEFVQKFRDGVARDGDLERLVEIGSFMQISSLCGLGQASPVPVLTAIKNFPEKFIVKSDERGQN